MPPLNLKRIAKTYTYAMVVKKREIEEMMVRI
jgi:hypothetical protein